MESEPSAHWSAARYASATAAILFAPERKQNGGAGPTAAGQLRLRLDAARNYITRLTLSCLCHPILGKQEHLQQRNNTINA